MDPLPVGRTLVHTAAFIPKPIPSHQSQRNDTSRLLSSIENLVLLELFLVKCKRFSFGVANSTSVPFRHGNEGSENLQATVF